MKIRDLMTMISATTGKGDAPASQLAIARGFLAALSGPFADVAFRFLSEAIEYNEDLYVCQSIDDARKYMQFGYDRNDFVSLTDPRAVILVSTRADYTGHDRGNWITVAQALEAAGNNLERFKAAVAP